MSEAAAVRADVRVIGMIGFAHALSHFFQLVTPALFFALKDEFDVSFAALGLAVTVFYVVSGVLQTLAGFLVDRLGGKVVLVGGLGLYGAGIALIGAAPSYPMVVVAFMIAGAGNSVFHPADLAILNARVGVPRLGYAFAAHGFGGSLGWVAAPAYSLTASAAFGWRAALVMAGAIGIAAAALLASQSVLRMEGHVERHGEKPTTLAEDLRLLSSMPVLMCFGFFTFSAVMLIGMQTFSIPTLVSLHGLTPAAAAGMLSGFLAGGAIGMLSGGVVATRSSRHAVIAAIGVSVSALFMLLLGTLVMPEALLAAAMMLAGFFFNGTSPSRDVVVRTATPEGARGKVYGFVYSGLDLGSAIGPIAFGWFLDRGQPQMVFYCSAAALALCVITVLNVRRRAID